MSKTTTAVKTASTKTWQQVVNTLRQDARVVAAAGSVLLIVGAQWIPAGAQNWVRLGIALLGLAAVLVIPKPGASAKTVISDVESDVKQVESTVAANLPAPAEAAASAEPTTPAAQ